MCESCINRLFLQGPGPCPICKTTLRKSNFKVQTFEDLYVEKEVLIRRKVGRYFNKRQEDFKSLLDYNNYLEECEEIIFNMINNVNVQETNEKIEKYRIENKDLITQNTQKQKQEEKQILLRLEKEKLEKQRRNEKYLEIQLKEKEEIATQQNDLISLLEKADSKDVYSILKEQKKKQAVKAMFVKLEPVEVEVEMQVEEEEEEEDITPLDYDYSISVGNYSCSWVNHLANNQSATAGGYNSYVTHKRALVAMHAGLFGQ
jgi:CDK-activating kinase assembly factor MAT1